MATTQQAQTFCPLCVSRCGATATITDGEFVALGPDPAHPTGQAVCVKGKAAPDIVRHPDRLEHPVRRTAPKGAADPRWERISWDEALGTIAERVRPIIDEHGPEALAFGSASPSTSASSDAVDWLDRLRNALGTPNLLASMELCGWGRYLASLYTYGTPVPGAYMPDLERAGCILFWGYNPSVARLVHATQTAAALRRGAKLVVIDPRRAGLATKADHWLRVRPGTDGALALAMTHVMLDRGWFDRDFVAQWTTGPALVRNDTGRLLRATDLDPNADDRALVAWDKKAGNAASLVVGADGAWGLDGVHAIETVSGAVECTPVLARLAAACAEMSPDHAAEITGVPADQIEAATETLCLSGPLAYYAWSGLEQQTNATQTTRAVNTLYALTGSLDQPGGNVLFTPSPAHDVRGLDLMPPEQLAKAVGVQGRPLGPARFGFITGEDGYAAMLGEGPYRLRAMVNFGQNMVLAHADSARIRDALNSLDFFVHADLFMNPTAELADIVLPVTSAWEAPALRDGFEVSQDAVATIQLRQPVAQRRGECRSDTEIIFALADRLGVGDQFWGGDVEAGWAWQVEPTGLTLEDLAAAPGGIRTPVETRHRKFTGGDEPGFRTPTGRIELYQEEFLAAGYDPLPTFVEPLVSPRSRPDLAKDFPLVLTSAKSLHFCETQHRQVAKLRKSSPDPEVELHPDTASERSIAKGDWVRLVTPDGSIRARASLDPNLDPGVVVGHHGWWQGCDELELPAWPVFGDDTANLNLLMRQTPSDPISGSTPLRAWVCDVQPDREVSPASHTP